MKTAEQPKQAIEFIVDLQKRGKQPSTVKRYRYDLEDYLAWIRVNKYSYTDNRVYKTTFLQTYFTFLINERCYSFRTLKRVYSVLRQYHGFLVAKKILRQNPVEDLTLPPSKKDLFSNDMFLTEDEVTRLRESMQSEQGLTENQLKAHAYLSPRNNGIVNLMLNHGLSLYEVCSLDTRHISFIQREITITSTRQTKHRVIKPTEEDLKVLFEYYQGIPTSVRPRQYSIDPFFVAFDFQRLTYRWSYEGDSPKRLTEIAVQKMIRQEVKRAGLRKGISAQHFRRTAILNAIQSGLDEKQLQHQFGLKTILSTNRYYNYVNQYVSNQNNQRTK